ncbi:TIGR03086 family metal-binding protein [Micromonospora sp. RTGN7]|uniref:TIGR03086 family metal-binding protein n=1 Tax=Micromonospora sp. RTGN7 TaxID=3016526 RepID=UPI0029FEFF42|nr:TIGR03086 family metal-binding protein [Micromonospora sp. RTGN7]
MTDAAVEHRAAARAFTERVRGVAPSAWDNPTPCEGWVARDVVRHLTEWLPAFLSAGAGVQLPKGPAVDDDPVAAWVAHNDGVQALLDDPSTSGRTLSNPHLGEMSIEQAISMIYIPDVFIHTWDLARATGQDERLDPDRCARLLEGMRKMDGAMRGSAFGPQVEVAEDADVQTRLLAFTGRRP